MKNNIAVVVSNNRSIYQCKKLEKDNNEFENLTDSRSGILNDEQSKNLFKIPVELNVIINENPLVIELIKTFKLKLEENVE
jgi:hypothetical protein